MLKIGMLFVLNLWWKLNWFSLTIPRHTFILWLVVRNSLTTGERLLISGDIKETFCVDSTEEVSKEGRICCFSMDLAKEYGGRFLRNG